MVYRIVIITGYGRDTLASWYGISSHGAATGMGAI